VLAKYPADHGAQRLGGEGDASKHPRARADRPQAGPEAHPGQPDGQVNKERDGVQRRRFRQQLGQTILLGLELLVAGDIVRTVAASPSLTSVAILAAIVLIRTFLSFSLEVEITGRWPWQKREITAPLDQERPAC